MVNGIFPLFSLSDGSLLVNWLWNRFMYFNILSCSSSNSLMSLEHFCGIFRIFYIEYFHLQTMTLFYFFPLILDSFYYFSFLIVLARIFNTNLNKSCKSGNTFLFTDLRLNTFSFSPLGIKLSVGLSYIVSIMLRYVLSMP